MRYCTFTQVSYASKTIHIITNGLIHILTCSQLVTKRREVFLPIDLQESRCQNTSPHSPSHWIPLFSALLLHWICHFHPLAVLDWRDDLPRGHDQSLRPQMLLATSGIEGLANCGREERKMQHLITSSSEATLCGREVYRLLQLHPLAAISLRYVLTLGRH